VIDLCPSNSWTVRRSTPFMTSRDTKVPTADSNHYRGAVSVKTRPSSQYGGPDQRQLGIQAGCIVFSGSATQGVSRKHLGNRQKTVAETGPK
jgi:hypothetical protein